MEGKDIMDRVFSARIYHLDGSFHLSSRYDQESYQRDLQHVRKTGMFKITKRILASVLASNPEELHNHLAKSKHMVVLQQRFNILTDLPFAIRPSETDSSLEHPIQLDTVVKGCNLLHCSLLKKLINRCSGASEHSPENILFKWKQFNQTCEKDKVICILLKFGVNHLDETSGIDYYKKGSETHLEDIFLGGATPFLMSIVLDQSYNEDVATKLLRDHSIERDEGGKRLTFNSFYLLLAANNMDVSEFMRNDDIVNIDQNPPYTLAAAVRNFEAFSIYNMHAFSILENMLEKPRICGLEQEIDWGIQTEIVLPEEPLELTLKDIGYRFSLQHKLLCISVIAMILQFHKELPLFPLLHWARRYVVTYRSLPAGKGLNILKTIEDMSKARMKFFQEENPNWEYFDVMLNKLKTMNEESDNHGRTRLGYERQMLVDVLLNKQSALTEEQRIQLKNWLKEEPKDSKNNGLFKKHRNSNGNFACEIDKEDNPCIRLLHTRRFFEAVLNNNRKKLRSLVSESQGNAPREHSQILLKHVDFQMRFDVEQKRKHLSGNSMQHCGPIEGGSTHIARSCNALHCARLVSRSCDTALLKLVFQLGVDPTDNLTNWCMNTPKMGLFPIVGCSSASLLTMSSVLDKPDNISRCTRYIQSQMEEMHIKMKKEQELIEKMKVMEELNKYILEEEENERKDRQNKK